MNWSPLHARVHQSLRDNQLIVQEQGILLAISGGQDSLCLGQLMLDLASRWQWSLAIAHCNHGWEGDTAIADHVEMMASRWQLPFFLCTAATSIPETEAAARQWRYEQLTAVAIAQNLPLIATGHTLTDRAETLLFNLVRGSGMGGLGALTARRSLQSDSQANITLVRPLLSVTRVETAAFCQTYDLPIYEDSYNQNLDFSRNRLRQKVFPELKTVNAQAEQHLAQTAQICAAENEYLAAIATTLLQNHYQGEETQALHRLPLRDLHLALQRRVMQQYLLRVLRKMPHFRQIEACRRLIYAPNHSQTASFSGTLKFVVQQELILPSHH